MNKKQLKELIKNDIETNYTIDYNKEEALSHFVAKERKSYNLFLKYAIVCLIGVFIGMGIFYPISKKYLYENITKEFEKYVNESGFLIQEENLKYNINFYDRCNIIIYRIESKEIINYYYIIKIKDFIANPYLFYENRKIELTHNSFGLLDSFNRNTDEETIKFYIEIDGKTIEYILN